MKKTFRRGLSIALALCLVLCGNLHAIATEQDTPAADTAAPVISHTPVQYGRYEQPIRFTANISDETAVKEVWLSYRAVGSEEWTSIAMTPGESNEYTAELSGALVTADALQYYLQAYDGTNWTLCGSEGYPLPIMINRGIFVSKVEPAKVEIGSFTAGQTVTVTGEGFTEGMTVMLDETQCTYTLTNPEGTEISLTLPQLPICAADLQITNGENHCILFDAVIYKDSGSLVSLTAPGPVFIGQTVRFPVSVSSSAGCEVTDVALELLLDTACFENAEFIQSDANMDATASCSVSEAGLVSIRISSGTSLQTDTPIGYLSVRVKETEANDTVSAIGFQSAKIHDVDTSAQGIDVTICKDISVELLMEEPGVVTTLAGVLPDCSDWQLEISYPDQETKDYIPVTPDMISMEDCTVLYMGIKKPFTCNQISPELIEKLEITTPPDKTVYLPGDSLDLAGMVVSLVYKDGTTPAQPITNYTVEGYNPDTPGIQPLTVRCGELSATVDISVVPRKISSEVYTIAEGYLQGIPVGTTAAALLEGMDDSSCIRVFKGETELTAEDTLSTGMTVKLMIGETVFDSLTLIVTGDVNGDGKISVLDTVFIKSHTLEIQVLSGAAALAADYNSDGKLSILDYVQVKAMLLGLDISESL